MLKWREYFKMKDLRALKHFINVFSKQKSVKREFDETFTKSDESYLGTTHSRSEYSQIFRQPTDFCPEKLKVERNEEHGNYTAAPAELIITVLPGQEVEVTYHYSMPLVTFRVDGTMKIFNMFSKINIYSRNEQYGISRLDEKYAHNEVVLSPTFDFIPKEKDAIELNMKNRTIDTLVVEADDTYIEDEEHLKSVFRLAGTENVSKIIYRINQK
jgi:hypothetical protein